VVFVLFDISGSTSVPAIRRRYAEEFEKVLEAMRGGELVMGDRITENSLATANPFKVSFPAYHPLKYSRMTHQQAMKSASDEARQHVKKLLQKVSPRTDLMNAFQLADKVFNGESCRSAKGKILIVFSDMIEQSSRYDFTGIQLTPQKIQQIIESERKGGRLPNLKGVKVWVAGATAAMQGGLSSAKIYEVQNFWLAYFRACGADLTKERYGTTLLNFELKDC